MNLRINTIFRAGCGGASPRKSEEEIAALEEAHKRVEAARQALMKEIELQKGE